MLPPKVFAIYRRESETFQLLTYEADEYNNIQRLKCWSQPRHLRGVQIAPHEDKEAMRWFLGTEWYVEPTPFAGHAHRMHQVQIHDKVYYWWSLHHKLVWSSYIVYQYRFNENTPWATAPQIPILEFNSRLIYPRMDVMGFYPRWASVKPMALEAESDRARSTYMEHKMNGTIEDHIHDHVEPKYLKIRTPPPEEQRVLCSDDEFTPPAPKAETVSKYHEEDAHRSCAMFTLVGLMMTSILGTWVLIGLQVAGY